MNQFLFIGFITALLSGLVLTPLVRYLALRCNFMDRPGPRKIHTEPIAYGGGFAVLLALLAGFLFCFFAGFLPAPRPAVRSEDIGSNTLLVLLSGALASFALGLVDDIRPLGPRIKLLGQLLIAIATVAGGVRLTVLVGDNLFMQAVTVCWLVLITNSFNLLDNMDGLCSGTVAIVALLLSLLAVQGEQWLLALLLCSVCGASLSFYCYNRSPARIFLGDAGSLLCGYLLACCTVLVTYYRYTFPSHLAVGIPLLILAIPLYDTASVIWIRLREGRPVMKGDTSHFSHRLVDLGMTRRQAVLTIHLACLAIGLPATVLGQLSVKAGFLIIGQGILVLTIIALLEHAGRKHGGNGPPA